MHSSKSRRRKEGPCQASVSPLRIYHSKLLNDPNQRLRHQLLRICGYDVHLFREMVHPAFAEKKHCEISSLSTSCNLIGLDVPRALKIALFISLLVNRSAPGTTSENDTHLPTKHWRLLTETVEHARDCSIRSRNFSFFSGIRLGSISAVYRVRSLIIFRKSGW